MKIPEYCSSPILFTLRGTCSERFGFINIFYFLKAAYKFIPFAKDLFSFLPALFALGKISFLNIFEKGGDSNGLVKSTYKQEWFYS